MNAPKIVFVLNLALFPIATLAADQLKPGQWEMSINTKMKNMPEMSAEDLAAMKQMGINMPGMGEPMRVQQCITPEQATMKEAINPAGDQNCTVKNYKQKGNTVTGDLVCTGDMQATGKFETTMAGNTGYHSKMSLKGTSGGEPIDQEMETTGKWVKDKCDPGIPGSKK
jgi:hypothetical protein